MSEKLLIAGSSSDPFSVIIVDPRTGVASWSYKGSELQGGAVGAAVPLGISGDHLLVSIKDRPLIHAFAVHPRDRYHHKAVVGGTIASFCTFKDGSMLFAAIGTQIFVWSMDVAQKLTHNSKCVRSRECGFQCTCPWPTFPANEAQEEELSGLCNRYIHATERY
ncbi:hypothetical protein OSTOST_22705 [Ostertagia ostertagi]